MNDTTNIATIPPGKHNIQPVSFSDELSAIKKDVHKAISLAQSDQFKSEFSRVDQSIGEIMQELRMIASGSKDPKEMAVRLARLVTRIDSEHLTNRQLSGHSVPLMPPVVFHRVPKLSVPLVNRVAIEEAVLAEQQSEGLEGFLDNMFSNDRIYDDVIRKLRSQIIELDRRNGVLESNLDLADAEITYWRKSYKEDKPLRATSPPPVAKNERQITEKAWKLSISKFIGSIDQFVLMKSLFHWKMYVEQNKSK